MLKKILITSGEPSGIGPDIVLDLALYNWNSLLIVLGNIDLLQKRAELLNKKINFKQYSKDIKKPSQKGELVVIDFLLYDKVELGYLNKKNSYYVMNMLDFSINNCLNNQFNGLVTGPIHKDIIVKAGFKSFTGHTDYLAQKSNINQAVMLLKNSKMKVALVTTHIPLSLVPTSITKEKIEKIIRLIVQEFNVKFKIKKPVIYVCGLNPHAGEDGLLGTEEITIINPTLEKLRNENFCIEGPFPGDTIYQKEYLDKADVILAMYHDQGLATLKSTGFDDVVNITLGLPFHRFSVGHGTALNLAGTNQAKSNSLITALKEITKLVE